jgi:redox-sensitive bicupin YhaK (pirin superfamily)
MTAGVGVQHSELFPLLKKDDVNTLELFQIWLNLPKRSKKSPAYFKMFWSEKIPQFTSDDKKVEVSLIAGQYNQMQALPPPPDSWAADPENEVTVLLVKVAEGGVFHLPRTKVMANRTLYFFAGEALELNGQAIQGKSGVEVDSSDDLEIQSVKGPAEFLLLQARAMGEPVFQHGPFVMNTREDIVKTFEEYQRTQFGGWPWPEEEMVHGPDIERFAKYPDGRTEKPGKG